ncbi:MAG: T9SS type A sorting domain-containing protein [Saprospiraceae bacterium]|nr:T9SS type A sorting domain-containing protein [Saprospiraceae bacterium]MDW8484778.1 hypothetical protein [Saprospiraceae bacterium]
MRIPKVSLFLLWLFVGAYPMAGQMVPCVVSDLVVDVGECTSDSTFQIELDFKVKNPPSNEFVVFGNGVNLGTYKLSDLPLTINNFPAGAGLGSFVRVCMKDSAGVVPLCCGVKQFFGPNCTKFSACEIYDVKASAGNCLPLGGHQVKLDFKVKNATGLLFEVWTSNNVSLGVFPLAGLPITLNIPPTNQPAETLRICLKDSPNCCASVTVILPTCPPPVPCAIRNMRVETGECTSDSTYKLTLNFAVPTPTPAAPLDSFDVYAADGRFVGRYAFSNLPVTLNFPWNGKNVDAVKVCWKLSSCCRRLEFNAPSCIAKPCGIDDVTVGVGLCLSPKTYQIKVAANFSLPAGTSFKVSVQAGNGDPLGTFDPSEFPLNLVFPASGEEVDRLKICLLNPNGVEFCCKIVEFKAPKCDGPPCPISDLKVEVAGPCNPDGTYPIVINFNYTGSTPAGFAVWSGDGKLLGVFPISALPLKISKFPASGKDVDRIRVCLITPNIPSLTACCLEAEFKAPDCKGAPCGIGNIKVVVGPCNPDGTYRLVLNFIITTTQGQFAVWAGNGQFLGIYPFSALPLTIPNFPGSGKDVDVIRVCVFGPAGTITPTCCITHEFKAPNCQDLGCKISDLTVKTGDCNLDGTYRLQLNFKLEYPLTVILNFSVWGNGKFLGTYSQADLPVTISNFPASGKPKDVIKVCALGLGSNQPLCCESLEFDAPNCQKLDCKITNLTVKTGDCNPDGTYKAEVSFNITAPSPFYFSVWANGKHIGTFPLGVQLVPIPNFPASGKPKDIVKVCVVNPATAQPLCCESLEFDAPNCQKLDCKISDLSVKTGDCNPDGTYRLSLNFKLQYPLTVILKFSVWGNGKFLGTYSQADLPVTIFNFPASGKSKDVIKVCALSLGSDQPLCCESLEFDAPSCAGCEIKDLEVAVGDCNPDGTYRVKINFKSLVLTLNTFFSVWGNGVLLGTYPIYALPVTIPNFPASGGKEDKLKVCIVVPTTVPKPLCCVETSIKAPDCVGKPCEIWDVKVQATPCLCGQFFAVLTFRHQNGSASGFNVMDADGKVLASFPYGQPQPLILGPFEGDGKNSYVFRVQDKEKANCSSYDKLAAIDCPDLVPPVPPVANTSVRVSPNPATDWITVATQSQTGAVLGQAVAEIRKPDGRLLRTEVVPNGNMFTLQIAELPAGIYRLSVQTAEGRYESTFVKQ